MDSTSLSSTRRYMVEASSRRDHDDLQSSHRPDTGSDRANAYSGDAVVFFNDIHRSHTQRPKRPENEGALSANPRMEREMQRLCNKFESNAGKIAALRSQPPGVQGTDAALQALRKKQQLLATRLNDCMTLLDPDLTGTIMDRVKTDATKDLEQTFQRVWDDYQRTQRSSCTKYLWTIVAGGIAYTIPFGTGTLLARGLGIPYLVTIVAAVLHTLAEPLWTMVRATTWTNPASEAYTGRQRARARANGDAWRYLAHVPPKTKMLWVDPVTGQRVLLTAAQALATNQELWLWMHKTISDDVTFLIFSVLYAVKNVMPEFFGRALFDRSTPEGMRNDLLAQYGAGFLSGALTMLAGQRIRRGIAPATGGREVVAKTLHIWRLEARYLKAYAEDIRDELSRSSLSRADARLLRAKLAEVTKAHEKARAKSRLPSSIHYEFSVMFQKKRLASGADPDMPGKRLDTACSILGKVTSLLPSLAVTYLTQPLAQSPDPMTRLIAHVAVPFALVVWPGFAMRTEFQDWYRSLFGAAKGMVSALRAGCCCAPKDPEDAEDSADSDDSNSSADSDEDSSGAAPGHGGTPADTPEISYSTSTVSEGRNARRRPANPDGVFAQDPPSAQTSSETSDSEDDDSSEGESTGHEATGSES